MTKKLTTLALFLLLIFLAVEFSYRFYIVGTAAFHPVLVNSMNTIMRSEFVQLSEYPDIFFELKPNMQGYFKGNEFRTNSVGLPDREYPQSKPDNAYRVAVAGSSWEMPSGVEPDEAWHDLLEQRLNSVAGARPVEFINFGVEMYGLREIVGTVKHKILAWDPDLIVVAITPYTMSLVWEPTTTAQALPPRTYPFFQLYTVRALQALLGLTSDAPTNDRQRLDETQQAEQLAQLQRAFRELGAAGNNQHAAIAAVFLGFFPFDEQTRATILQYAEESGIRIVFANGIFPRDFRQAARFQLSSFDRHPNGAGHELIADFVGEQLREQKLLPASESPR